MYDVAVVGFDAMDYTCANLQPSYQYFANWITRDTWKAFVAFKGVPSSLKASSQGPVATGNWGCGAFGGDAQLKALLQLCACLCCAPFHHLLHLWRRKANATATGGSQPARPQRSHGGEPVQLPAVVPVGEASVGP